MNVYDSIKIEELLAPHGYKSTANIEDADLVVLNTCHIREKAAEKVYSELGRVKKIKEHRKNKLQKDTKIAVAGCVGQAEGEEIFSRAPYVDIVVGPQTYYEIPQMLANIARSGGQAIELDFIEEEKFDKIPELSSNQGASSFVSIQEGCDKFCHFCVVPYTRGAEFSRTVEQVYREVLSCVSRGSKEVTLLGQNVNAYHGRNYLNQECNIAYLINKISSIKGLERIRYMTSHPRDVNTDLINVHRDCQKLMPFLHLPVQSGSNNILKLMNRKHTREEYFDIIKSFRDVRPDIVFSSDFIVGFPGETDKDFEDTLDLVKQVKFGQCYSFKYSVRPGTPASLKEQIPDKIKTERLRILQSLLQEHQRELNQSFIGSDLEVLFDRDGKYSNQIVGKTPYMQSVYITDENAESLVGAIRNVRIISMNTNSLGGQIVKDKVKSA